MFKFEVGKVYTSVGYWGTKSDYIVLKRNDETQRITVQWVGYDGKPYGEKISRKIQVVGSGYFDGEYDDGYERITITAATMGRVCYTGGRKMSAVDQSSAVYDGE